MRSICCVVLMQSKLKGQDTSACHAGKADTGPPFAGLNASCATQQY